MVTASTGRISGWRMTGARNGRKTMTEYIEREAAEDAVGEAHLKGLNPLWELRDVPAADVVPVVHGKWMPFHSEAAGDIQYCSACEIGFDAKTDYCPHCGAKMDGGADNV